MSGICDTCKRSNDCRKPLDGMDFCRLYVSGKESNYSKLFGTPERAARTLYYDKEPICSGCALLDECMKTPEISSCMIVDYDELLEWLRGDA